MIKIQVNIYFDRKADSFVVRAWGRRPDGTMTKQTRRVHGKRTDAVALGKTMAAELKVTLEREWRSHDGEQQRSHAAKVLGLKPRACAPPQTLSAFLTTRWAQHVAVAQNATTRRTTRTHVAYLCFYAGEVLVSDVDAALVANVRESLLRDGPRCFTMRRDGEPRRPRTDTFTPTAVNRIMATMAAAVRLAEREGLIDRAPAFDLLPVDNSHPIVPPTDDQLAAILKASKNFVEIAPLMPEAIELAAFTGMRAGEQFALTWRSVDLKIGDGGAIRIEAQHRARLVDGQDWRPKHLKSRLIILNPQARDVLLRLRERVPHGANDPVLPSKGGAPYNRLEAAPDRAGVGYFPQVVEAAGLDGNVRWHDLRHYFAVKALLAGVPVAVVSSWLGHSDINLTVKRYGRWGAEAREQWQWAKKMGGPVDAVRPRATLGVIEGGADKT